MLTEQHRLAHGLEEGFNRLFYGGKITNAPETTIDKRPVVQSAIDFIQNTFGLYNGIPYVCINVTDGVCLRGASKSRFNLQNVITDVYVIRNVFDSKLHEDPPPYGSFQN